MAPFYQMGYFGEQTGFVIALVIGISFGFWLERAGFGDSRKLALQFYFEDMTVLKVMFTAIITAMLGLMYLTLFGWLNISEVYMNPTFAGAQAVGGIILGIGFAVGGYCPGTAMVGASTGRIDAFIYIAGALSGMIVFGEVFPFIEKLYYSGDMGYINLPEYFSLPTGVIGLLSIIMAIGMFLGAEWLEKKFRKEPSK
jgi:hypothetical protein